MRVLIVSFSLLLLGCKHEGAPPVAPLEAVSKMERALPPVANESSGLGSERCSVHLSSEEIDTGEGCSLDERVSTGVGTLHYPCSRSGEAEATFGDHQFKGVMSEGQVVLTLTTELDGPEGCRWRTEQKIQGNVLHPQVGFRWTYSEAPVRGRGCFSACEASAEIKVEEQSD